MLAAGPVHAQQEESSARPPVAVRDVLAARDAESLWVVLALADERFIVRHRTEGDAPDTLTYPNQFKEPLNGMPIALAPAPRAAYIVYQGGLIQRLRFEPPKDMPVPRYDMQQVAPLPDHERLIAFTADARGPIALLREPDNGPTGNTGDDATDQDTQPQPTAPAESGGQAGEPSETGDETERPTPAWTYALHAMRRGEWRAITLPDGLNLMDRQAAMVAPAPGAIDLLVWNAERTTLYRRRDGTWTTLRLDLELTGPTTMVISHDRTVIVDRPGHDKQLRTHIIWQDRAVPGGTLPLPDFDRLLWSATAHQGAVVSVIGDGRGNLAWARRDLTEPAETPVQVRTLKIAQRQTPMNFDMLLALVLLIVVIALALNWRRRLGKMNAGGGDKTGT